MEGISINAIVLTYRRYFVLGAKYLTSFQCYPCVQVGSFATEQFQNGITFYLNGGALLGDTADRS